MNLIKIGLILAGIGIFVFACDRTASKDPQTNSGDTRTRPTDEKASEQTDELASARKNFSDNCVKCHKEDGKGGVSEVDGKEIRAPNFSDKRIVKRDDAEFVDAIKNGFEEDGMPPFKDKLSEDEIKGLINFIRKNFQGK